MIVPPYYQEMAAVSFRQQTDKSCNQLHGVYVSGFYCER